MTTLHKAPQRLHSLVQGQYLMTCVTERQVRDGQPFRMIQLEDATGELAVYVSEESAFVEAASLLLPVPVRATLYIRHESVGVVGDLRSIHCAPADEVKNAAQLLPRSGCPGIAHPALEKLVRFNDALAPLPLRTLVNSVFLDSRVFEDLLICPAGLRHYRDYPGGLLEHTAAILQLCETLAGDRLTPLELAIAQVAALVDQIDRKRVIQASQMQTGYDELFDRSARSNQMLEFHLSALRAIAPDIAKELEGITKYLAQPNSRRSQAPCLAAEIAHDANRFAISQADGRNLSTRSRKIVPISDYRPAISVNPFDP